MVKSEFKLKYELVGWTSNKYWICTLVDGYGNHVNHSEGTSPEEARANLLKKIDDDTVCTIRDNYKLMKAILEDAQVNRFAKKFKKMEKIYKNTFVED